MLGENQVEGRELSGAGRIQSLSVGEGVADAAADFEIAQVDRVEGKEVHLFEVRLAILGEKLLIDINADNLRHKETARLALIDHPGDPALESHRKIGENRSLDLPRLLHLQSGLGDLVLDLAAADKSEVIRWNHCLFSSKGQGQFRIGLEVLGGLMAAERNDNLVIVPGTSPGGIHCVRCSVGIKGTYDYYGLRHEPRPRFEIFHDRIL